MLELSERTACAVGWRAKLVLVSDNITHPIAIGVKRESLERLADWLDVKRILGAGVAF